MGRARKEIEQFSFVDNPKLHRAGQAKVFVNKAEAMLNSGAELTRNDEQVLFKGLHACGYAIAHAKKGWSAGRRIKQLKKLHARIINELVKRNLGLVYDMKSRFARGLDEAAAMSESLWVLGRAVKLFDPWRGFRFSTYACTSILRGFRKLRKDDARHSNLAKRLGGRLMSEQDKICQPTNLDNQLWIERIQSVLADNSAKLVPTECYIIQRRFFCPPDRQPETLESIGKIFGVSKERIRQLQERALGKLHFLLTGEKRPVPETRRRKKEECCLAACA